MRLRQILLQLNIGQTGFIVVLNPLHPPRSEKRRRAKPRPLAKHFIVVFRSLECVPGFAFVDPNQNGTRDRGEPGLSGWTIYLDEDGNGELNVDVESGRPVGDPMKHSEKIFAVAFSPDAKTIAAGGGMFPETERTELKLWDVATGTVRHRPTRTRSAAHRQRRGSPK